ncbi:response regulator [Oceanospirillum linum]|uniref:DNA-binding response regulator n=1 Tax=Oceanospirillum linum TaxID=966 RepID=A0A1T1HER0_OCELI|nr:response regulator transcription factor [Oceanospirillum linum]OOV88207.1 DNA-binding response regulator [Oceanospirillum linum]SEF47737.1 two component transcriptional regulator, winged helix family [Oleiphilus messinensis]SMP02504.1 two component transcriptional regulator, winged helix family [Oceanospirillum linum]
MSNERLLLVDDDKELCSLLMEYLSAEGYQVDAAYGAEQAIDMLQGQRYSLMVLDIMMPGTTGLELLQQIRPSHKLPVIMLTGRGDEIDRILGLEMGADDYLGKPCNPRELLARIRAVLRRSAAQAPAEGRLTDEAVVIGPISVNPSTREAKVSGELLELTSAEFNVLTYLMQHAGQVLSKEQLTRWVLHRELTAYDRAIDVHVSRVRQKLVPHFSGSGRDKIDGKELIKTVRGQGYIFVFTGQQGQG